MARQPESCVSCGEETAAGTLFYSDRQVLDADGPAPRYLCSLCAQSVAHGRKNVPMTEKERHALHEGASGFGVFVPGGH
jgi:hypothetical protein